MSDLKKYEKDESKALRRIAEDMNRLHARMGGRDCRPERVALLTCMQIIHQEIERSKAAWVRGAQKEVAK